MTFPKPELPELGLPTAETVTLADFGPLAPADRHITVDVDAADPDSANHQALDALMDGASSLLIWVHSTAELPAVLASIDTAIAPVHLVGDLDPAEVAKVLPANAQGLYNADPLEQRARSGTWFTGSWSGDLDRLRQAESVLPSAMGAVVSNALWAAPQGAVAQLAWGLASLQASQPAAGRPVGLVLQATPDYFETAAMAQAARLLWTRNPLWMVGRVAGSPSEDAADLVDRGLQAQALALGGCRDLWIQPLNDSPQAARWARHQALVLYYESGLLRHDFPLRGSYLLEDWTAQLADAARAQVARWDARGGLPHLLDQNLDPWN
ncbi:MAG: methylmalonyl-CoA mutase family protein [Schleiferiaceae bacterium]